MPWPPASRRCATARGRWWGSSPPAWSATRRSCRIWGSLQLFVTLSLCAGLLSFAVGLVVSARISRPVRDLTAGLRQVASGNYAARVRESGVGELAELAGGFNAMTEQLERLRSMEAEMRRRETLATLGEAATTIAHEIRNPLGIIKTSSQVIRSRDELSPGTGRLLDFVLDEVKRIDHLVQDLIDYARPRALRLQVLDLAEDVIAGVADFAEPELSRRGITCVTLKPAAPVRIVGDAELLHQAFLNVLINAMEAMPEGGRSPSGCRGRPRPCWPAWRIRARASPRGSWSGSSTPS
ncbi:sensor histidine kinase [Roseomonas gilardii]|uniref:sensor histidine kinase n=1 Tax=Roseomonas gilardii TaxID=257708 RepID=UPI003D13657F